MRFCVFKARRKTYYVRGQFTFKFPSFARPQLGSFAPPDPSTFFSVTHRTPCFIFPFLPRALEADQLVSYFQMCELNHLFFLQPFGSFFFQFFHSNLPPFMTSIVSSCVVEGRGL